MVGNVVRGPEFPVPDERTRNVVTPACNVELLNVGNSEGDSTEVQVISKSTPFVRIQLHRAESGQRFADTSGRRN